MSESRENDTIDVSVTAEAACIAEDEGAGADLADGDRGGAGSSPETVIEPSQIDMADRLRDLITGHTAAGRQENGEFSGKHSVQLQFRAGSVNMDLTTNTESGAEAGELRGQLAHANQVIGELNDKLQASASRIGYLEAQLDLCKKLLTGGARDSEELIKLIVSIEE